MATTSAKSAGSSFSEATEKAKEHASGAFEKTKEVAGNLASKAKETASNLAEGAGSVASSAVKKADDATTCAGSGMKSFAQTIRDRGPEEGMMGTATRKIADTLEGGGEYLEEHGLSGMASDFTALIKRNPIPALFVGIGIGYLLARATSRS